MMWTNVFRIGELQAVSWFQFLPNDYDPNPIPEKSLKAERKDGSALVLSAHLQLQLNGFLSTWTNSFVGPWDPSQGVHNPDEKIKLWLFLPGRHSSIKDNTAQAAVSRLREIGNGIWLAPGDSEEVAIALSQALRNSIERALKGLSYTRFGDVFTRCHSSASNIENFRRAQPTIEFIFTVTEEAIYVHAIISAKYIRGLSSDDMERVSKQRSSNSVREGLPVIVSPNGMRGRLAGCCPSDLVKQVYFSKLKASKGSMAGVPFDVTQSSGCRLRGQNCYAEVTLGCSSKSSEKTLESSFNQNENALHHHSEEAQQKQQSTHFAILQKTFIYKTEAVLVPLMHMAFTRTSLGRFWHKNCPGTALSELWPLWSFPGSSHIEHCLAFGNNCNGEFLDGLEVNSMRLQCRYNGSSNSNSSSISSVSSTSSETDHIMATEGGDLEADADSLGSKRSGLSSSDQFGNDLKMVKRPRIGTTDSYGQIGKVAGTIEWGWDDEDADEKGIGIDIQLIISEFGDFGDFFENDILNFGEPPGTVDSQALMYPPADCNDVNASPFSGGLDIDQKLSPIPLGSFEEVSLPSGSLIEDTQSQIIETARDARSSITGNHSLPPSMGKFDHLTKVEAMMTFAPEYAAIEAPATEFSSSVFKSPYLPRSKRVESLQSNTGAYAYGVAPLPPCVDTSEEKRETSSKVKLGSAGHDTNSCTQSLKLYNHVQSGTRKNNRGLFNDDTSLPKGEPPSSLSVMTSSPTLQRKNEAKFEAGKFLLSQKTVLATDIECVMLQAAMCRIRHTLVSLRSRSPFGLSKLAGNVAQDLTSCVTGTASEMIPIKYEVKKKDLLPARIAGEVDGGVLDEPLTSRVGVWRSVGVPKGTKSLNMRVLENSTALANNVLNDDDLGLSGQWPPLQELLDAMALLVQQSTSFVDVSLDMDGSDSSYSLLALQEQRRRGFSCGPSMVHAGCGGLLATCHSVDIAGVDLIDPVSADVQASSVISLLQSDIKLALKSAFGSSDGPLSVIDWCKGRVQSLDSVSSGDVFAFTISETKDSPSSNTIVGEPMSPSHSISGSSSIREGPRIDEAASSQRRLNQELGNSESEQQKFTSRCRPTVAVLPLPSILVGYQDDWLKTSANCLQFWEKAPLEPYALQKPVTYCAVCPDINLLTSAAVDFFQQLGTVYETCKLGTHSPQICGVQLELSHGKCLPSGLVVVDCPDQVKIAGNSLYSVSSISDYFQSLYKGWDLKTFTSSLTKVLRELKLGTSSAQSQKEGSTGPCMVVYVVCPFPEPTAVLRTLIESSAALGSAVLSPDRERQSWLHSQVSKAQSCSTASDEALASNVLMLSGFSIPKLVLQIVTVDCLLRVSRPVNELAMLKDIAFTVYNKARRIQRGSSNSDLLQSSALTGRPQPSLMHATPSIPGMWKDCLAPRMSGSTLSREGDTWDNSWQPSRAVLNCDPHRYSDLHYQDDTRYLFEPLFILAEPGSLERGSSPNVLGSAGLESFGSKPVSDDSGGIYLQSSSLGGSSEVGTSSQIDGSEHDTKSASLHCCYGWTEDWRWLVCIWTDSRGELLDCNIFPFGGISSRQDTKVLQSLFVQVLNQACQILSSSSPDSGAGRPRDIIITRIGCFFELECQEWQSAIYSVGGNDVKKWLQLRRSTPDILSSSTNGNSLQQHEMGLIQERNLPSSPSSSLYSPRGKAGFMKSGLGQANTKKQFLTQTGVDNSRGLSQLVQSISLVGVSVDHSLHLMLPSDSSPGAGAQNNSNSSGFSGYIEGFSPVKSLGTMPASYILIPSPNMRYLPTAPLQLPTCLTSESPPLAHLLHSKGSAIPLATGYIVSKSVSTIGKENGEPTKDHWPSVLAVSLVDHYGGNTTTSSTSNSIQEKMSRGGGSNSSINKQGRSAGAEAVNNRDYELETHLVLETVAAELHSLSWMTVSPVYLERRTALPFHCDMILRLRRLLHYADREFDRLPEGQQNVS